MSQPKHSIFNLSPETLAKNVAVLGQPAFRAKQIYRQLYVNLIGDYTEMSDLPEALRKKLITELPLSSLELKQVQSGDKEMTRKALFSVPGGAPVETVLMIYPKRATVCVSTQSGCAMGCTFCATAKLGFRINLSAGQMIEQVLWAARTLKSENRPPLTNIVYMGMGEPFNNYDAWWESVTRLHDPKGFNMGARGFTVSTVGIIPGIKRLANEKLPINLAISLHAPDDDLRSQLVPINRKYPIADLLAAVRKYIEKTHRRVSFEYVLLEKINDTPQQAEALAQRLRGMLCHVNLIPWNPIPNAPLAPSIHTRVLTFQQILDQRHIPCTVRTQRGVDIDAACGQLAGSHHSR